MTAVIEMRVTKVEVSARKTWSQMNRVGGTGGGAAFRDAFCVAVRDRAIMLSPVNDPDNARHRKGRVGRYKRSWRFVRARGPAWQASGIVRNTAPYASVVEYGRSASNKRQRFSWTGWGGEIRTVKRTRGRGGKMVLHRAVKFAGLSRTSLAAQARANSPYAPR